MHDPCVVHQNDLVSVSALRHAWANDARWQGITRPYTAEAVVRLRGRLHIERTIAKLGAERLWNLLHAQPYVTALGAVTPNQAVQMVTAGLDTIYVSGQVAANASSACHAADSAPQLVRRINDAFVRADEMCHSEGVTKDWFVPLIADAEVGFGGSLNVFELTKALIDAGAACVHFEDQIASANGCGLMERNVLVPTSEATQRLVSARLAADVTGVPTLIMASTDANDVTFLTSNIDPCDKDFLTGQRSRGGLFYVRAGIEYAIARALSYAPYADLLWCQVSAPNLQEAQQFAKGVLSRYPGKLLAYNCSPSFNWRRNFDDQTIALFERELAAMGYKFIFVNLAGFHSLNLSIFELACNYKRAGMTAYSQLQKREFARESDGYDALQHERFAGSSYFEGVMQNIFQSEGSDRLNGAASIIQMTDNCVTGVDKKEDWRHLDRLRMERR